MSENLIFRDDLSSGTFNSFEEILQSPAGAIIQIVSPSPIGGVYAADSQANGSGSVGSNAYIGKRINRTAYALHANADFMIRDYGTSYFASLIVGRDSGQIRKFQVGINSQGYLVAGGVGPTRPEGLVDKVSATKLNLNQKYKIKVRHVVSATAGEMRVWLDGVEVLDLAQTGRDTTYYSATYGTIYFGLRAAYNTAKCYFNNIVISEGTALPPLPTWQLAVNSTPIVGVPITIEKEVS